MFYGATWSYTEFTSLYVSYGPSEYLYGLRGGLNVDRARTAPSKSLGGIPKFIEG